MDLPAVAKGLGLPGAGNNLGHRLLLVEEEHETLRRRFSTVRFSR